MDATTRASAARHHARHGRDDTPDPSRITEVVAWNAATAAERPALPTAAAPARKIAVVTCMDARIEPSSQLGLAPGDAHVIRNAGGVLTEDVIRSLAISQHCLGTEAVMLIHHSGCGLEGLDDEGFAADVERACGRRPPFAAHGFLDAAEAVRRAVERVRATPYLLHRDDVRGFVFDVRTGLLTEVTPDAG